MTWSNKSIISPNVVPGETLFNENNGKTMGYHPLSGLFEAISPHRSWQTFSYKVSSKKTEAIMATPRKAIKTLKLHGTYRKDRHGNRNPPKVPIMKTPEPPAWLKDDARKLFFSLSKQLVEAGILTEMDTDYLAIYSALYIKGIERMTNGEDIRPSYWGIVRGMASDLGLTPQSRERLSVKPVKDEPNEFGNL